MKSHGDKINLFRGGFLGMALGDALASPAQGLKPGRVKQLFGRLVGFVDPDTVFEHTPTHWRTKGVYSLVTQQALAVAESLLVQDGYVLNDIVETFRSLGAGRAKMGLFRGLDKPLKKALANLKSGKNAPACGVLHPGIGAASRTLPLALGFMDDEEKLLGSVLETSLITHCDPRAVAGAAAYALAATALARKPSLTLSEAIEFTDHLQNFVRRTEERLQDEYGEYLGSQVPRESCYAMSDSLSVLGPCLKEDNLELVKQTILAEANRQAPPFPITVATQDFSPSAICYVLYIALTAKTLGQGMLEVINEGKEACAAGGLVGGLLGLRFGEEAISIEWIKELKNAMQVALRGEEIALGFPNWSKRIDLVSLEEEWTNREREEIARRKQAYIEKKKKSAKAKLPSSERRKIPPQEEAPFAPPPGVVFGADLPDPIRAKKEKALRGKKRIQWKEERKRKRKKK